MNVVSHYTLGNVYAVLMEYNKSIDSFHEAVTIQDDLEWVKKRKAAVKVTKGSSKNMKYEFFVIVPVPQKAGDGPGSSTQQTSEYSGGTEILSDPARLLVSHEHQAILRPSSVGISGNLCSFISDN